MKSKSENEGNDWTCIKNMRNEKVVEGGVGDLENCIEYKKFQPLRLRHLPYVAKPHRGGV